MTNVPKSDLTSLTRLEELPSEHKELLSSLIGLVRASVENNTSTPNTATILQNALLALSRPDSAASDILHRVRSEKALLAPDCAICMNPCARTADYPISEFLTENYALRVLKSKLLFDMLDNPNNFDFAEVCRRLFLFGYAKDVDFLSSSVKI